jgi:autotransporter-associated beta strand protein
MRIIQNLWSSLLRSEIKKIIPSHLRLRAPVYFLAAAILMLLLAAAGTAFGGSATWNLNATGLWNNETNWTPPTVPNGPADTATFGVSNSTDIGNDSTGDIEVNSIVFNAGASAFTISFGNASFFHAFTISGVGITNNSGITQNFVIEDFGEAATMIFKNSATAGDQTVFTLPSNPCCGSMFVEFHDTSTAGNATLIGFYGDFILFSGDSTGGTSRVEVFGNGSLDISAHNAPGVTVGSIEGEGLISLGANNLTIGSNNLSTIFYGLIQNDGSLTKIGTGTLALTGSNTYAGGTTIEGGKLVVNNMSGSGTGSGTLQVNAGTLVGRGTIAGAVTVGTGSGAGAVLAPGKFRAGKTGTLTIQSTLTFNSDATYEAGLNTNDAIADQVVANGVIISGAQFSLVDRGSFALTQGTVFTVIDNRSGTPIAGAFANLADGSTFTKHGNTFQVSYEGGDGNDLTLTVQ